MISVTVISLALIGVSFTVFLPPLWGMGSHLAVVLAAIACAVAAREVRVRHLLLATSLVSLVRVVGIGLGPFLGIIGIVVQPVGNMLLLPYYFSQALVFSGAVVLANLSSYDREQKGLSFKGISVQVAVGLSGVLLGAMHYFILKPGPQSTGLNLQALWLPAFVLAGLGMMEEYIFRGVIQRAAQGVLGKWAILFASVLSVVAYLGFVPSIDLVFVFFAALFYGFVVTRTRSLVGVGLSRALHNVFLFVLIPLFFG